MYFLVRLLICPFWSCIKPSSLVIVRALRWKYGRVYSSPRQKCITRNWALVPSPPSWGLMAKTTEIIRSKWLSLRMHVTSLTCYFDAFDEEMVVYLTIWTMSDIENPSKVSFAVVYLECVSGGRKNIEMLWSYGLSFLCGIQLFFVDRDWQKE